VTRLSRAALVAFGTGALALTAPAGCSSSTTSGVSGGETNYAPPYGAVPFDAAVEGEDAGLVLADAHVGTGDAAEASAADAGADAAGDAGEDATASDSGGGDGGGDAADGD
jgi:hypothetical protein